MSRSLVIGVSLAAHVGFLVALDRIDVKESQAATAIEVVETQKEKPKPPPETKVEPPQAERTERTRAQNPKPAEAPPEAPPEAAPSALDALPDFGLELGGSGGPGGFGIAQGKGPINPKPAAPVQKSLSQAPAPLPVVDECAEGPAKPKLKNLPQPNYTDAARAAGVEGKVRVQITVDETGQVVEAKILSSLGHGLDEAALTAAKAASFEAAVRCGKPTRSTFTISIRFSAT